MRNTYIILLLFCFNYCFGQEIQHEPEKLLRYSLVYENMPSFAKENNILKVNCNRGNALSSSITFDRNGNIIETLGNENSSVRKTIVEFDNLNREIERRHYKPDGTFQYGYYYEYFGNTELTYILEDSSLLSRYTSLDIEKTSIYTRLDSLGNISFKTIIVHDNDNQSKLELRFNNYNLNTKYHYEYVENEKFVTKSQYNENGEKYFEKRYLSEKSFPNKNIIKHYTVEDERHFRTDKFDSNNNLIKMELFPIKESFSNIENIVKQYKYKNETILTEIKINDLKRDTDTNYKFVYNEKYLLEKIIIDRNGAIEVFNYEYVFY